MSVRQSGVHERGRGVFQDTKLRRRDTFSEIYTSPGWTLPVRWPPSFCKVGLAVTQACFNSTRVHLRIKYACIGDYISYTILAMHIAEIGLLTVLLTDRRLRIAPIRTGH